MTEIAWRNGVRSVATVRPGPGQAGGARAALARPDGAYLVTGGLGGLGLLTARRLAERGARHITVCGRRPPAPDAARLLEALRTGTGATVDIVLGDIADPATARAALHASGSAPLRGVIHAAGVVEDATLMNAGPGLLERVWRGKAEGAWALHRATAGQDLDYFVMYSSAASLVGSPGQGTYAAANAFLDALVAYRRDQGLSATGIHWGAWSKTGRVQHLAERGFVMISPEDGMDALERILAEGRQQVAYSPLDIGMWTAPYPALRSSTLLRELLGRHCRNR